MPTDPTIPYVHLYAQPVWHAEAYLVGTRAGLTMLAVAIERALARADGTATFVTFAGDGEGYPLQVRLVSESELLHAYVVPYTDEIARPAPSTSWPREPRDEEHTI